MGLIKHALETQTAYFYLRVWISPSVDAGAKNVINWTSSLEWFL